jgi:hypothetical protein
MKGKYLRRLGGLILATLMLAGIAFISPSSVQAQRRRRIVVVRPIYRPFGPWGYGYGYRRWGYDPWSPYGGMYRQYVFSNGDDAVSQGYKDGFKTGKDDGKKNKSYDPQRSHYYHDSRFGNFAEVYRSGFSRGYQEGYQTGSNHIG